MIIYIVQQGDTIDSIADKYKVPTTRLIIDNGLEGKRVLVPGQTIVIAYPVQTYTVQEGDSLIQIANNNGITVIQLLRNNPFLSDREYIYPGEILVIQYDNVNGKITTNGYANAFINMDTLRRTLPFLSYLSVFGYRANDKAEIMEVDDTKIIQMAKEYKVLPIMLLSTLTAQGVGSIETAFTLLYNDELVDKLIENLITILKRKGYYGVNITFQFINKDSLQVYERYTNKLSVRLKQEGYLFFITISENFYLEENKLMFEKFDISKIGQLVDGITLLNYNWGYSYGPPSPVTSVNLMEQFFDYIIPLVPPEKIEIGLPIIGYDWELPYIIGVTKANSLTLDSAMTLAGDVGATILFDEVSQTPYYQYTDEKNGIFKRHIVWFIDARTVDAILKLVMKYGFRGTGIWNVMYFYSQMWLTINSQYEIETLLT